MNLPTWSDATRRLIEAAIDEDLGPQGRDLTCGLLPNPDSPTEVAVVARRAGVIAGLGLGPEIVAAFSRRLARAISFEARRADGDAVEAGSVVATLRGPLGGLLTTERTLLNFLGRMSGVATLTREFVSAARAGNADVVVLDTRKTLPGWRELDKYAVRAGGGENHRLGLFDAVLIKDNHIAGVSADRLTARLGEMIAAHSGARAAFVEVEVDTLAQFDAVCAAEGVDYILLDNFALDDMREAVRRRDARGLRGRVALEVSGGVTLATIRDIAATGVDRISVGALTHSAVNFDVGLDIAP